MAKLPDTLTDKQAMFNAAYKGLHAQGFKRSVDKPSDGFDRQMCMYRGLQGRRCAIGHCIPNKIYKSEFERRHAGEVLALLGIKDDMQQFAVALQNVHDGILQPELIEREMREFAFRHKLTMPIIADQQGEAG